MTDIVERLRSVVGYVRGIAPYIKDDPLHRSAEVLLEAADEIERLRASYNREVSLRDSEQRQAEEQQPDNPYDHGRSIYERGWFDATEKAAAEIERLRKAWDASIAERGELMAEIERLRAAPGKVTEADREWARKGTASTGHQEQEK